MNPELVDLYRQMSDHTKGVCGGPTCYKDPKYAAAHRCCSPEYCEMAKDWAKAFYDIELKETGHRIPFMGPEGCIVAPHLRPICTVHACCINNLGCHPADPAWTERYFDIRNAIEELETGESQEGDRAGWMYDALEEVRS